MHFLVEIGVDMTQFKALIYCCNQKERRDRIEVSKQRRIEIV